MELWIRSQDREQLRKIVDIKYQKGTFEDEDTEVIIGTTQYDEWEVLGTYKSKERALEVLDEIENKLKSEDNDLINKLKILENTPIINCSNNDECEINVNIELLKNMIIYEMPED